MTTTPADKVPTFAEAVGNPALRATPGEPILVRPLEKLIRTIRTYVVLTPEQTLVVALWVVHTHAVQSFYTTPYLAITSPEKQCGKTTLLGLLDLLVARPWSCTLPSEA